METPRAKAYQSCTWDNVDLDFGKNKKTIVPELYCSSPKLKSLFNKRESITDSYVIGDKVGKGAFSCFPHQSELRIAENKNDGKKWVVKIIERRGLDE